VLTALNSFDASNLGSGSVPLARISGLTSSQMAATYFLDEDDMASDSATAVSSQQAVKAYVTTSIAAAVPDDDAFGSWASKSNNTVYLAASDGFVCAFKATAFYNIKGYTDGSNPPTTIRVRAAADQANPQGISITFPVKKNDYWKVTGATTVYWLPVGA